MKSLTFVLFFASSSAFALDIDSPCMTKQKNAASMELAQALAVPVQSVEVLDFKFGGWTEAVGNNVGSDDVIVRAGNRINRGMTIKTYSVGAKQIGNSDDCKITSVTKGPSNGGIR